MKAPPTLADACIATALDKNMAGRRGPKNEKMRKVFLEVAHARKFVLDPSMSRFLADLHHSFLQGGMRKRLRMLENARQFARLPHALTWIEFQHASDYLPRIKQLKSDGVADVQGHDPARMGFLFRQHPHNEAAFCATEIRSTVNVRERAFVFPFGGAWCADDSPSPWQRFPSASYVEWTKDWAASAEAAAGIAGYRSTQAHFFPVFDEAMVVDLVEAMIGNVPEQWRDTDMIGASIRPAIPLRTIWALLATLNDLPIKVEHVEPSRGYVARGSYKKFLQHSVIKLTVPETRFRALLLKSAALLRRRAHQVRGHWRKDWRHPLSKACEHDFNADMICRRCGGHQIWIAEHQRGDASIGFVTHDYAVTHEGPS